jgi:hypothetical protein
MMDRYKIPTIGMPMTTETITIIISIISALIAFISVIFARKVVERADKTLSMQVITQIFTAYSSTAMNADFVIVWKKYFELWQKAEGQDAQDISQKVLNGEPLPAEVARLFYEEGDLESEEIRAIDNVLLFWLYVALLISQDILKIEQLAAFMTPRILGFLYPIEVAKAEKFGYRIEPKSSLEELYKRWKRKYPKMF